MKDGVIFFWSGAIFSPRDYTREILYYSMGRLSKGQWSVTVTVEPKLDSQADHSVWTYFHMLTDLFPCSEYAV